MCMGRNERFYWIRVFKLVYSAEETFNKFSDRLKRIDIVGAPNVQWVRGGTFGPGGVCAPAQGTGHY